MLCAVHVRKLKVSLSLAIPSETLFMFRGSGKRVRLGFNGK